MLKLTTKKTLILGHSSSGKDQFAEFLVKHNSNLSFESSSLFVCAKAVFPTLSAKYGYKTIQECYADRDAHRPEWYDLISAYNVPKHRLASELLAQHDMYVGLRNNAEFQACQQQSLFDMIFWVDGTKRTGKYESRASFDIDYDPTYMILIDNNGTLGQLEQAAKYWAGKL